MNSESNRLDPIADKKRYEFPIDHCNQQISTSLKDLANKYKELDSVKVDAAGLKNRLKQHSEKSDLKRKS